MPYDCLYIYIYVKFLTFQITWANLRSIGTVRASSGQFTFQTNDINCIGSVCDEYEIGIVMAELQDIKQAKFYRYEAIKCYTVPNISIFLEIIRQSGTC